MYVVGFDKNLNTEFSLKTPNCTIELDAILLYKQAQCESICQSKKGVYWGYSWLIFLLGPFRAQKNTLNVLTFAAVRFSNKNGGFPSI